MTSYFHSIPSYSLYTPYWSNEWQQQLWIVDDYPACACVNNVQLTVGFRNLKNGSLLRCLMTGVEDCEIAGNLTPVFLIIRMIACNITDVNL